MHAALRPRRINYECLGNVVAHVHWHLVPRYEDDPAPTRPIWVRAEAELDCGVEDAVRDALVSELRPLLRRGRM
jgi:diadenosine tetraphosphate (Ap4A) HIT family hydrolase